ncbi:MAG: 16S rRNA (uracil(1498)-N(3))-methyltransferase [Bacteroidetes bacterium]|nr:16S rRNA (uracil(1498)-N(3))-methyltransferase [Bacteroidota bacterium]
MAPFFYHPHLPAESLLELDADTSHHIAQVLRMHTDMPLHLTDGSGTLIHARLQAVSKKSCSVSVEHRSTCARNGRTVSIAIATVKNNSRLEWFVEKATELGVSQIIPVLTERTEKQRLRIDRLRQIAVAAMLQSQQVWLPQLEELRTFAQLIRDWEGQSLQRWIAHCVDQEKKEIAQCDLSAAVGILIGPEGDFTESEIAQALAADFNPVQLGNTRLRTETAGVVAAAWLRLQQ